MRPARGAGALALRNGALESLRPGHASFPDAARRLAGTMGRLLAALGFDGIKKRREEGAGRPVSDKRSRPRAPARARSADGVAILRGRRPEREIAPRHDACCTADDSTLARLGRPERAHLEKAGSKPTFPPFPRGFAATRLVRRIMAAGRVQGAACEL